MPRTAQITVNVEGIEAVRKLARALEEAVAILECDRNKNCVRVQAQLDRGQPISAGTCWWDDLTQRLLRELPGDACRYCRTNDLLKRLDAAGSSGDAE